MYIFQKMGDMSAITIEKQISCFFKALPPAQIEKSLPINIPLLEVQTIPSVFLLIFLFFGIMSAIIKSRIKKEMNLWTSTVSTT